MHCIQSCENTHINKTYAYALNDIHGKLYKYDNESITYSQRK